MLAKLQILVFVLCAHPANPQRRIFNGTIFNIEELPFLVKIFQIKDSLHCTGSYIHSSWILTAFHCVSLVTRRPEKVICCMGNEEMLKGQCKYQRYVKKIEYPYNTLQADIALLKIEPFKLSAKIQVGRLLEWGQGVIEILGDRTCKVAGWGRTETQKISKIVLLAEVYVMKQCPFKYSICVKSVKQGPCPGDSGAPLLCFNDIIVGVLSTGDRELCGNKITMTKFVQLDIYLPFIYRIIDEDMKSGSKQLPNSCLPFITPFGLFFMIKQIFVYL